MKGICDCGRVVMKAVFRRPQDNRSLHGSLPIKTNQFCIAIPYQHSLLLSTPKPCSYENVLLGVTSYFRFWY